MGKKEARLVLHFRLCFGARVPRITIWNPTSVPITDPWFLYQVGVTNHFMLVLSGDQNDVRSGGAARDDNNVEYWRAFNDARRMSFYNMMNANRNSDVIPSGGSGEPTIAVLIPAHNEASRIAAKIENTLAADYPKSKLSRTHLDRLGPFCL